MTEPSPLRRVIALLATAGIPHMLTGSFASTFHGPPRSTQDIDIVIAPSRESLERLLESLPADLYYVSPEAARDALARRSQFNVVDLESGWKVDLIIRKERPFSVEEFSRRRAANIAATEVFVTSPEDTILSKLEWSKLGESDRQLRDAAGVLRSRFTEIDNAYLDRWAARLDVVALLERARGLANS